MAELASTRPSKNWSSILQSNKTILVVLGILTTLLALPAIFSTLALYDDEGYVMMTLKTYMQGHRLYGETHTQYGPAFYLLTSPLHAVFSWPLTQDGIRTKTLVYWVIAVWLCFFIVKRISHSTVASFATALLAALQLDKLALEPGHPQEITLLCTLAILSLFAKSMYTTIDAERTGFAASSWLTVGFLTGIVGLVKMNCGVVVAIPLIVIASLHLPWAWRVRWGLMAVVTLPALMVAWLARTEVTVSLWALWITSLV